MERTEDDKVTQSGIKVMLGGKEYEIVPLVIKYSKEWRKKALPLLSDLLQYTQISGETEGFKEAMVELFTTKTDGMVDSFFEYARDLPREEIEDIATDGEVILAFMEVFNVFVAPLSAAVAKEVETSHSGEPSSSS